ncbi:uncharacterized protein [Musca autumnalis]|uniref:uncharacterized protein n=1 Tax=Musca autumnalis TaxID=221902 RepID=UPI003CE8B8CE
MSGLKLIKTTFQTRKEIVAVKFDGLNDYNLFVNEVKKTYNIPPLTDVEVLNKEFPIKPHIFMDFVLQYISSTDFVLDIKLAQHDTNLTVKSEFYDDFEVQTCSGSSSKFVANTSTPKPQHPHFITEVYSHTQNEEDITNNKCNVYSTPPPTSITPSSVKNICDIPELLPYLKCKYLENKDRTKIAKAIIINILGHDLKKRLLKEDFIKLSEEIVDIFPFEIKETYYIPFTKGRLARGKLYDAYNNYRRKLNTDGLISTSDNSEPENSQDAEMFNVSQEEHYFGNESMAFNDPSTLPSAQQIRRIPGMIQFLKRQTLENKDRSKIANTVIAFILNRNPKRRLFKDDFLQLSQTIVEIFPLEIRETYYIPFTNGRLARGKLYDAYNNQKTKLCAAGIITRRSNANPENNCESIELPHCNSPQVINDVKSEPCDDLEFESCSSSSLTYIDNIEAPNSTQNHYFNFNTTGTLFGVPSVEQIKQIPEIKQLLKYKTLQNKDRVKVAKAIVAFLLNPHPNRQLLKEDFLQLSQSIVEIFSLEIKETYYIPYSKGQLAKGKLFDAYNNHRSKLVAAGLLTRRAITRSNNNEQDESLTRISETISPDELEVLIAMDSDWNTIKDLWRKSYAHRRKELISDKISAQVYLNRYNISKLNENFYDLLYIDFNILYSTTKHISEEWKIYYSKLIARFQQSRDTNVMNILANISKTNDEDCQLALSLMLIPYILPIHKITKLESQESFICYKNNEKSYDKTESPAKRIKTETQPKVYFVGDDEHVISAAYLDLFDNRWKFENPLKAVEACFYCYTTMNIKYPQTCHYTWTFLQKIIYEINTPHDIEMPAVNTLIHDLRREN